MSTCPSCDYEERPETGSCPRCGAPVGVPDQVATQSRPIGHRTTTLVPKQLLLEPGHRLGGKYEILRHLGRGGFADVYLAHDHGLDKDVAVKVLRIQDVAAGMKPETAKKRFVREAQALSRLDGHPNIVRVLSVDEEEGNPYFVMEYFPDGTLGELIVKAPLSAKRAASVVADIASALTEIHKSGTIHRDIKPGNIFLKSSRALLGDFGIAYVPQETRLTSAAGSPGTPMYMSPEMLRCEQVDSRTDLFALGCVLYESLTGEVLFMAHSLPEVIGRIMAPGEVNLESLRQKVPAPLLAVLKRSLAKKKEDRYGTTEEMEKDLQAFLAAAEAEEIRLRKAKVRKILAVAAGLMIPISVAVWFATRPPARTPSELLSSGKAKAEEAWDAPDAGRPALLEEAVALFSAATKADPSLAEAWFQRGVARQLLSENATLSPEVHAHLRDEALKDLKQACELAPAHPVYCERARLLGPSP